MPVVSENSDKDEQYLNYKALRVHRERLLMTS